MPEKFEKEKFLKEKRQVLRRLFELSSEFELGDLFKYFLLLFFPAE
jgi:hypothetical protein